MQRMPKYWLSEYYNRDTDTLSSEAPDDLKKEYQEYKTVEEKHEGIVVLY